jgi:hypothetical protein
MAREINWDEKLSDEDRAWAEQRLDQPAGFGMNMQQRIADNDEKFGGKKQPEKDREERRAELRTIINDAQNELERIEVEIATEGNPNTAKQGDPASGLVVDFTAVDGQTPEGAPTEKETYSDERYWTKAKLVEEIANRDQDRKDAGLEPLSRAGNRSELVERLLRDDRELEES